MLNNGFNYSASRQLVCEFTEGRQSYIKPSQPVIYKSQQSKKFLPQLLMDDHRKT